MYSLYNNISYIILYISGNSTLSFDEIYGQDQSLFIGMSVDVLDAPDSMVGCLGGLDVEKHLDVDETPMNVKTISDISDSSWFENAQNMFVSKFLLPHGTLFHWFILIFSIKRIFTPGGDPCIILRPMKRLSRWK